MTEFSESQGQGQNATCGFWCGDTRSNFVLSSSLEPWKRGSRHASSPAGGRQPHASCVCAHTCVQRVCVCPWPSHMSQDDGWLLRAARVCRAPQPGEGRIPVSSMGHGGGGGQISSSIGLLFEELYQRGSDAECGPADFPKPFPPVSGVPGAERGILPGSRAEDPECVDRPPGCHCAVAGAGPPGITACLGFLMSASSPEFSKLCKEVATSSMGQRQSRLVCFNDLIAVSFI